MTSSFEKKRRELLSSERGWIEKAANARLRIALVYPGPYGLGMSNLGFLHVYSLLNAGPDVICDRFFLPDEDVFSTQPLQSIDSGWHLRDYHVVAFSIPYEIDYIYVPLILERGGLQPFRADRDDEHPLVVAGGAAVTINPEPLADFIDLFAIGDGEPTIERVTDVLLTFCNRRIPRQEKISTLASISGVYAPSLLSPRYNEDGTIKELLYYGRNGKVESAKLMSMENGAASSCIFTPNAYFSNMAFIEVARGCPHSCRFCAAGHIYKPARFVPFQALADQIEKAIKAGARLGFIGAAVSEHPNIIELCSMAVKRGADFSLSSLRADRVNEELANLIVRSGNKTVSIAPETGTERLRGVLKKSFKDEEIMRAVELLAAAGVQNIKLYFMIGLPAENADDVHAIISFMKRIRNMLLGKARKRGNMPTIVASVTPFVPKPHTPFQWLPMNDMSSIKNKLKMLSRELNREPNIRITYDLPKWSHIQALLSRGDRRVGKLIWTAYKNWGNWAKTLKTTNLNPNFFIYRRLDKDEVLPWDFIDHGIDKEYLFSEMKKAISGSPCFLS